MATMTLPDAPAPQPSSEAGRYPTVFANLLPDEVIASRHVRVLQKNVFVGLAALLVLLIAWYGIAMFNTSRAKSSLSHAQKSGVSLQNEQHKYQPLINAQRQADGIRTQLATLTYGDLQWEALLTQVRTIGGRAITVTGVSGSVTVGLAVNGLTASAASDSNINYLNGTGLGQAGTLTVSGTARDRTTLAAYLDKLATVKGLAVPYPVSVLGKDGKLTFTVQLVMTTDVLGGRYTTQKGH